MQPAFTRWFGHSLPLPSWTRRQAIKLTCDCLIYAMVPSLSHVLHQRRLSYSVESFDWIILCSRKQKHTRLGLYYGWLLWDWWCSCRCKSRKGAYSWCWSRDRIRVAGYTTIYLQHLKFGLTWQHDTSQGLYCSNGLARKQTCFEMTVCVPALEPLAQPGTATHLVRESKEAKTTCNWHNNLYEMHLTLRAVTYDAGFKSTVRIMWWTSKLTTRGKQAFGDLAAEKAVDLRIVALGSGRRETYLKTC